MLIHSVTPVQMLIEQPELPPYELRQIPGGYAEGQWTAQGFQIARLCSTDPGMYLRDEYAPGSIQSGIGR